MSLRESGILIADGEMVVNSSHAVPVPANRMLPGQKSLHVLITSEACCFADPGNCRNVLATAYTKRGEIRALMRGEGVYPSARVFQQSDKRTFVIPIL